MSSNFVKFNDEKTKLIIFGSTQQLKKVELPAVRIAHSLVSVTQNVRNFGIQFDAKWRRSRMWLRYVSLLFPTYDMLQGSGATWLVERRNK